MADAGASAGNCELDLPVVDLSSSDLAAAAESIRKACVEYGFFYVINHGVEEGLLEKVFAESRRFFEQPVEEKMTLRWNSSHMGYTPPHTERLDASCKFRELNENFSIGPIGSEGSDNDANQWPSEERFPCWKETMKLYYATGMATGKRILSLIALSLNLDVGFFDYSMAHLRLLHYPGHLTACPMKLTKSTLHRVVPVGKERYSVAFFVNPNPDVVVQCLDSCSSESCPPRFPPITASDYLKERLNTTYK